jgi:hypothetical protein
MPLWRGLVQLLRLATKKHNNDNNDKAMSTSNDGRYGNGDGNGDGDSNGNDAAAPANSYNLDEDNVGNSRTKIGRRQLDNDNRTTKM